VQDAAPIRARIFARVSVPRTALDVGGAVAVAAHATHVTQASNIKKGKGRIDA
jgi:hypothetical protein